MNAISVVIITRNEEHNITDCVRSAKLVSDDIVVVDADSIDDTVNLAKKEGARVFPIRWQGYGFSRNVGAIKAKYDWILSLDADERISQQLSDSIKTLGLTDDNCIYRFRRRNYLGRKRIRFGTLGSETVKRLYNRLYSQWDLTLVHEKLHSVNPSRRFISGHIDHYSFKNEKDYEAKAILYAEMSAEKYFSQGKTAGLLKRYLSPVFNSLKSYVFQLGFLDGSAGWTSARIIAYYSYLKYLYLHQLQNQSMTKRISLPSKQRIERA
ncbi:MAG: glycosyltransferase family 2 protein [Flavisolibacter sp.]